MPPLRIAVTGSSGLIGGCLVRRLVADGHEVMRLVRRKDTATPDTIFWRPELNAMDPSDLEGMDAVIHLAGAPIAAGRWTENRKTTILQSRVDGTALMAEVLASLKSPPRVLISASAIGYYGNSGEDPVDETSVPGDGFLPEVCRMWEGATARAATAGIRVAQLRFGIVLSSRGGALAKMLLPFRLGLGGPVGNGRQWMSWVAIEDAVDAICHAIAHGTLAGPVNVVAPHPVRNRGFARELGRALHRPAVLPLPAWAVRLAFGEMGEALLLEGCRVQPEALLKSGFEFGHASLDSALRAALEENL